MSIQKAIESLNKQFVNINAVDYTDWSGGEPGKAIWFRQEGEGFADGQPYFNYFGYSNNSSPGVHEKVHKALTKLGLYAEPHDAGTWMAFRI